MKRSEIVQMPEYFDRYINKTDDVDHMEALKISLREIDEMPLEKFRALGDKVYAPGKWTIKEILQHMIDTERVFTYRAVAFARGETGQVLSFDEDLYAKNSGANRRTLEELVEEMKLVRRSMIALYASFTNEMLQRSGNGFRGAYSVLSIAFIMAGHQRWTMDVIRERYLPLVK
ncbi:MAG: DinB family protein [Bacteroidota bacterium]